MSGPGQGAADGIFNMKHDFDKLFASMGMGDSAGDAAAELVRTNASLKKKLQTQKTEMESTIDTLRTSKKFYQENFYKAKSAYERVLASNVENALALDQQVAAYVRECAEHETVRLEAFMSFTAWRAMKAGA